MRLIESGAFSAILLGLLPEEWQKCTCVQGIIVDAEIYCAGYFIHGLDIKHLIDKGRPASVLGKASMRIAASMMRVLGSTGLILGGEVGRRRNRG